MPTLGSTVPGCRHLIRLLWRRVRPSCLNDHGNAIALAAAASVTTAARTATAATVATTATATAIDISRGGRGVAMRDHHLWCGPRGGASSASADERGDVSASDRRVFVDSTCREGTVGSAFPSFGAVVVPPSIGRAPSTTSHQRLRHRNTRPHG